MNNSLMQELTEKIRNAQSIDEVKDLLTVNGLDADKVIAAAEKLNQGKEDNQELGINELEEVTGGFAITTVVAAALLLLGGSFISAGIYGIQKGKTKIEVCTKDSKGEYKNCTTTYR